MSRCCCNNPFTCCFCQQNKYSFWKFLVDCFMICLTLGFWLVWIFVRELRNRC